MFKQKIYQHCLQLITRNASALEQNLNELTEGVKNDSKSSAGDKHETSISMMQLEQEKIRKQLHEALIQKTELEKLNPKLKANKVSKGSLVKANNIYLYISIALGKITIDGSVVMVVSPNSPLGAKLMGKLKNEQVAMNSITYLIESIE